MWPWVVMFSVIDINLRVVDRLALVASGVRPGVLDLARDGLRLVGHAVLGALSRVDGGDRYLAPVSWKTLGVMRKNP